MIDEPIDDGTIDSDTLSEYTVWYNFDNITNAWSKSGIYATVIKTM